MVLSEDARGRLAEAGKAALEPELIAHLERVKLVRAGKQVVPGGAISRPAVPLPA